MLVHDSTFAWEERPRALETHHSTAREAAEVARAAEVGLLALTHISSRHTWRELRDEARAVFSQHDPAEGLRYPGRALPGEGRGPPRT